MNKRIAAALLALLLVLFAVPGLCKTITVNAAEYEIEEDGWYDSMEEVAIYLDSFGELPGNYITKKEAQKLGWVSSKGNLWDVAYGCSIGGDRFGNYEGLLPDKKGRKWTECDIDFAGDYRNGERIVFSNDGLIYYTGDHYESFDEIEIVWEELQSYANTNEDVSGDGEYGTGELVLDLIDLFLSL